MASRQPDPLFLLLPSLFSTGNLFFGMLAIYMLINSNPFYASLCILVATLFDIFDGRIARLANASTVFGTEYDSLCDLVSFGVAPALFIYHWGFSDFGRMGWIIVFIYITCTSLRLARFNTDTKGVRIEKNYFKGLPSPVAANFFGTLYLFCRELDFEIIPRHWLMFLVLLISFFMISPIPFRSFKDTRIFGRKMFTQLVIIVMILLFILIHWEMNLFIAVSLYISLNLLIFLFHLGRKAFISRAKS